MTMRSTRVHASSAALDEDRLRRLVQTTLPIAVERAKVLDEIRSALEQGDDAGALALVRRLCGLPPAEIVR